MTDKERLAELIGECKWWCVLEDIADYLIANGVVVQKQGHYITDELGDVSCSVCGEKNLNITQNYCPNCGAKMVKEDK